METNTGLPQRQNRMFMKSHGGRAIMYDSSQKKEHRTEWKW